MQAIADTVHKSVGFTKNCFDLFNICITITVGLVCQGHLIGIGLGTVVAVIGVGRVIAIFNHGFKKKMDDLAGMKIRVSNDPIMTGMVEGLGANPTVVAMGELYSALQTGVVDAAEQPIANYQANAFPEVAPNIILDGHTLGAIQVVITDEAWDSLTPEQQDVLTEAGEYASQYNRQISQETEDKILEELKADGVNVIEVDDITPWQDACKDVIEEATKNNKELYQQIVDMQ